MWQFRKARLEQSCHCGCHAEEGESERAKLLAACRASARRSPAMKEQSPRGKESKGVIIGKKRPPLGSHAWTGTGAEAD